MTKTLYAVFACPTYDYFYDWSGSPYRVRTNYDEDGLLTLTDACYEALTNVFARRLGIDDDLRPYARQYVEASVPRRDAVMLVVGVTTYDLWLDRVHEPLKPGPSLSDFAWDNGLDSMLISYLNGVPLEHILG